jgi:hypothetical protein
MIQSPIVAVPATIAAPISAAGVPLAQSAGIRLGHPARWVVTVTGAPAKSAQPGSIGISIDASISAFRISDLLFVLASDRGALGLVRGHVADCADRIRRAVPERAGLPLVDPPLRRLLPGLLAGADLEEAEQQDHDDKPGHDLAGEGGEKLHPNLHPFALSTFDAQAISPP